MIGPGCHPSNVAARAQADEERASVAATAGKRRREFIAHAAAAVAVIGCHPSLRAQEARRPYRVGFMWDSPEAFPDAMNAFRQSLRELGYVEGHSINIEYRYAEGDPARMRSFAEEFVRLGVDVIVAPSSIYTAAAKQATSAIPIIFMSHADPLGTGHVASLSRPGGNATGLSLMMTETNVKLLEVFKEALPSTARVAVVYDPSTPSHTPGLNALQASGPKLNIVVDPTPIGSAADFEGAFAAMVRKRMDAALFLSTPLYIAHSKQIARLALAHRLASLFGPRQHVQDGGLMSYSPDRRDLWRRGALMLDRVLKGKSPTDLPVEQPTKFELVVNLRTAKAIGVSLSKIFLGRADEVIE